MLSSRASILRLSTALLLAAPCCVMPTDRGSALVVLISGVPAVLQVGDTVRVVARVEDADGKSVSNAVAVLRSSAESVLVVGGDGAVTAVGPGYARILATVAGYAAAETASDSVRVRGLVEVDSVRPDTVRWGDTLVIYSLAPRFDSALVFVGDLEAPVKSFAWTDSVNHQGKVVVWAPVPAPASAVVALSVGLSTANAAAPVTVLQEDLLEPNDYINPFDLGVLDDGFYNPQLAIEGQPYDPLSPGPPAVYDQYVIRNPAPRTRTITFYGVEDKQLRLDLSDYVETSVYPSTTPGSWSFLQRCYMCYRGWDCEVSMGVTLDTLRFVLARLAATANIRLTKEYAIRRPSRYGLRIENGEPGAPVADSLEFNDACGPTNPVIPPDGTVRGLNLHAALDVDWFGLPKFAQDTVVRIRVTSDHLGALRPYFFQAWFGYRPSSWVYLDGGYEYVIRVLGGDLIAGQPNYLIVIASSYAPGPFPVSYALSVEYTTTAALEAWQARQVSAPVPRRPPGGAGW